ncbi:MAG: DUF1287 domain-containing protein [Pyrinomonadaceae bacterium]
MKKKFIARRIALLLSLVFLLFNFSCRTQAFTAAQTATIEKPKISEIQSDSIKKVLESAVAQIKITTGYDPNYIVIPYPSGDVKPETGVCSDVVIRAFRHAGVDLQKEVHEDMQTNFAAYPAKRGLKSPDTNIDHRRVPSLQTFFTRRGKSLPITNNAEDYKPGDVVAWDLDGKGMTHIGIVSNLWNEPIKRYSIIHNIGGGVVLIFICSF